MAKREAATTKQVNVRLGRAMVDRIDRLRTAHPLRPTWTQVVEAALVEWLERNDPPPKPKPAGR